MRNLRNTEGGVFSTDEIATADDVADLNDLSDEMVAMFIDGDLNQNQREQTLKLISKNETLRRKVSDYVKLKRYKNSVDEDNQTKIPTTLTKKAFLLFNKTKMVKNTNTNFEPIYINYSKSEYEINGVIQQNNQTTLNLELHIMKNGKPYRGEVYLYKGSMLYRTLKVEKEYITCDLSNKGNYQLFIKDGAIEDAFNLEFDIE
jgi:S-adenosylmethionine:tRNA-ribosyltransferase-isomerase (queuine synthetase)